MREMSTLGRGKALIVASRQDPASMNIAEALIELYGLTEVGREFEGAPIYGRDEVLLAFIQLDAIYAEHVDKAVEGVGVVIFASRHASRAEVATLSTHTPGNLGPTAEHGGEPRELAWSDPCRMASALRELAAAREELDLSDYSVCLEATHHGPTGLEVPALFVEIGSSPDRWSDPLAGEAVARAIWEAATKPSKAKRAVGFGGGHYAPKFTELVLEDVGLAVGHIVPRYAFRSLGQERWLVEGPVMKTWGGCDAVVMDKKGLKGSERRFVASLAEELGLEVIVI